MNRYYPEVMIDLETLDKNPTAAILSIGAVAFNSHTGEIDADGGFYSVVDLQSCIDAGLTVSGQTFYWWLRQSDDARLALANAVPESLDDALFGLSGWFEPYNSAYIERAKGKLFPGIASVEVYGNGADFDNPILTNAYNALKLDRPWGDFKGRCYRSLKDLFPAIKLERTGTHHNALDDAISQAEHAIRLLQHKREIERKAGLIDEGKAA